MKWSGRLVVLIVPGLAVVLGAWAQDRGIAERLTLPTRVVLDFRGRSVADIARTIESRTGKRVTVFGGVTKGVTLDAEPAVPGWRERKVTLEAPEPVPFWEAIDRLSLSSTLAWRHGDFGYETGVMFDSEGTAPSPVCYAGPFRVSVRAVRRYSETLFVRGPWVTLFPSGYPIAADASELASAPKDGGPLFVELEIAVEPGLVCRRDGPLRNLEALDSAGRSMLAPRNEEARQSVQAFASIDGGLAPIVRVPLQVPDERSGARSIRTLRGKIPVEIGRMRPTPALVIPLGSVEGKTFRARDAEFTVTTDRTQANGSMRLAFTCRLAHSPEPTIGEAMLANLRTYQIRVLDDRGQDAMFRSSGSGGDGKGTLEFSYDYDPTLESSAPPAQIVYHDLERTTWQVPFAFQDIPLP